MRISEKAQPIEIWDFSDGWSKYYVWLYPPIENPEKSKNVNQLILMNVQKKFLIDPFLLKEYNLFNQNTEISLEQ